MPIKERDNQMNVDSSELIIREGLYAIHKELIENGIIIPFEEGSFMDDEDAEKAVDALMTLYSRHYVNNQ